MLEERNERKEREGLAVSFLFIPFSFLVLHPLFIPFSFPFSSFPLPTPFAVMELTM